VKELRLEKKPIMNSFSWVIGGAQGSGVDSAANIFSRACAIGGLHLFGKREYYSNIKGEHSYFTVRISDEPLRSHVDQINMLVSFDAETIFRHFEEVTAKGGIIYDSDIVNTSLDEVPTVDDPAAARIKKVLQKADLGFTVQDALEHAKRRGVILFPMPFFQLLQEFAQKANDPALSRLTRMVNVMALSASMGIIDFDSEVLSRAIQFIFRTKKKVADLNVQASIHTYNYAKAKFAGSNFSYRLKTRPPEPDMIIVQGNQSSALGKMVAGCRFQTYYPITPASDDSEFLEANEILDLYDSGSGKKGSTVVMQTEDEISAITMAIGSALTGVRTATATSGPGFSLMAEALGWAGMNEVPVVVSLYQRTGPSTGLPTRHEQGDLNFAINAGHGEFPRIVFASGDIEESFYDSIKVFNFADRYQMPVIHMLDKAIANSLITCKNFNVNKVAIDRGLRIKQITEEDKGVAGNYLRFKLSDNPISAMVALGTKDAIFWNSGDEHTQEGHITEDPEIRVQMMDKRMTKLDVAIKEIPDEDKAVAYGNNDGGSDIAIISWGSTKGAILDALDKLAAEDMKVKYIQVRLMHPFPSELVKSMLKDAKTVIDIEMNYSGQLSSLVRQYTGLEVNYHIVKYNGRPMSLDEVYNSVKRIIRGDAPRRQVLKSGA
jgi:2-oxoglutarate/2-oxoacid ferredoxin oxidoreductase subunit alpha